MRPPKAAAPFQFLVLLIAGWIHRRQQLAIAYLQAENRMLRERLVPVATIVGPDFEKFATLMGPPP